MEVNLITMGKVLENGQMYAVGGLIETKSSIEIVYETFDSAKDARAFKRLIERAMVNPDELARWFK